MMSPLITVVTVTYNLVKSAREKSFRRAVESIYNQTYSNIEHIVIDGASDDGTLDLFKPYEKTGKMKVYSEPDSGIYNAMNKGLGRAKGKYIIYLNSDDFWHDPHGIEKSVYILELAQADFSVAPHTLQREDGSVVGVCIPSPASFFANMPLCHQTMLARTSLLREVGGFDEDYKVAADFDLVNRLLLRGAHPVYVPCNFTTFCTGGISALLKHDDERIKVFHKNYDVLIGSENAEKLLRGKANVELLRTLSYIVHPSVALNFADIVLQHNSGRYLTTSGSAVRQGSLSLRTKISCIFNIPLLDVCGNSDASSYKLLGFLPLCSVHIQPNDFSAHTRSIYLFGLLLLRYKYTEQTCRALLFGCITIYKKRIL